MTMKILVAVDLEDETLTGKMLRIASEIAGLHEGQVKLIYVAAEMPPDVIMHLPADLHQKLSEDLAKQLEKLAEGLKLPSESVHAVLRHGPVYREILAQAEADDTDLIVIGCHKPSAAVFLLGSNADKVARHAACSVYMVR